MNKRSPEFDYSLAEARYKAVLDQADDFDLTEGVSSYAAYRQLMRSLAERYGFPLESVIGAFVALSPNNDYNKNLRSLVTLLWGFKAGHLDCDLTVTTYTSNKFKAWDILAGKSPMDVIKGLKTRSFYQNILNPEDRGPVTIDGHMVAIASGRYLRMSEASIGKESYHRLAGAVTRVANKAGLIPSQVQAVCWLTWKRLNQAVYDPQLTLNFDGDATAWKINRSVDSIRPYPLKCLAGEPVWL